MKLTRATHVNLELEEIEVALRQYVARHYPEHEFGYVRILGREHHRAGRLSRLDRMEASVEILEGVEVGVQEHT